MAETNQDLSVTLKGEASGFVSVFQKAVSDFKESMKGIEASSISAKASLDKAFGTLDIKPISALKEEAVKVRAAFDTIYKSAGASGQDVANAATAMKAKMAELEAQMRGTGASASSMGAKFSEVKSHLIGLVAGFVGFAAIVEGFHRIVEETGKAELAIFKLSAAMGTGLGDGKVALDALKDEALRTGQAFDVVYNNATKINRATKDTDLAAQSLKVVNDATAKFGLTASESAGLADVFAKMLSKGSATAKDLKPALLDVKGGIEAVAAAAGKTPEDFFDELKNNTISATQVIGALSGAVDAASGKAGTLADTYSAKMSALKDLIGDIFEEIGNAGVLDVLKEKATNTIESIKKALADPEFKKWAKDLGEAIASVISGFISLTKFLIDHKNAVAALIALGFVAWLGSVVSGMIMLQGALATVATGLGAAAVAARVLSMALIGTGIGAIIVLLGTLGSVFYGKMTESKKSVDSVTSSVKELNEELSKVKVESTFEGFKDIDTEVTSKIRNINIEYGKTTDGILAKDKKAADEFKNNVDDRLAKATAANAGFQANEERIVKAQKDAADRRIDLDESIRLADAKGQKESINREIQAATQKNVTLYELEQKLERDKKSAQQTLDSGLSAAVKHSLQVGLKAREDNAKAEIDLIKHNTDVANAQYKIEGDTRKLEQKKASDAIKAEENALKGELESNKAARLASQKQEWDSAQPLFAKRAAELKQVDIELTAASIKQADDRVEAERIGLAEKVNIIQTNGATVLQEVIAIGVRRTNEIKATLQKDENLHKTSSETIGQFITRREKLVESLTEAERQSSEAIVKYKEEEVRKYEVLLKAETDAQTLRNNELARLDAEIKGKQSSAAKQLFDAELSIMNVGQQQLALQSKITESTAAAAVIREKAANAEGEEKKELLKELNKVSQETESYALKLFSISKATKDSADSTNQNAEALAVLKKNMEGVNAQDVGGLTDQKNILTAQREEAEKAGGAIDTLKIKINTLKESIRNDQVKVEIKIQANIDQAKADVENYQKKVESTSIKTVIFAWLQDAISAIASFRADQESRHISIVVDQVPGKRVSSSGDAYAQVETYADGGAVRGAGTATSDSIPAMLSNGEYVINAASVKRWGVSFFNNLNYGYNPSPVRNFAMGGLATAGADSSKSENTPYVFNISGQSFRMQGAREQAMGLASALQQLSRAA